MELTMSWKKIYLYVLVISELKHYGPEFRNKFKLVLSLHEGWPHVILDKKYFLSTSYLSSTVIAGAPTNGQRSWHMDTTGEQEADRIKDTITVESEASFNEET